MTVLYTSTTVFTTVYIASGDCMLSQKHLRNCSGISSSLITLPSLLTLKEPFSAKLRNRCHLEEDRGPSLAGTPRRAPPSPHHHWWNWAESSSPISLSGVYHHIRRQDRQGSKEQNGQSKQHFLQTLQKCIEQQTSEDGHYRVVERTTLLYGSESWVTYCHHLWLLELFHQRCLYSIHSIHWSNYVSNVVILDQAEKSCIEAILL